MSIWKLGQIIQNGKYVIDQVLGAGGAGITYRAKDTGTGKIVAIKTLNAMIQAQPDFKLHHQRFVQEAFRLAKSTHPHVIRVDDVFQEGELWCMIMEYIDGGNLEFLTKKKGSLSQQEAIRYISQVGSALAYVHQQGMLHRDVKPANIMLRPDKNEAVLIDFGLARDFIEDKTQIQTNSRTEGFAPIEQYVRRAKRGAYTDVYALAATMYFLVTVKIPFPAQFRAEGMKLVPPKHHNPEISDAVNYAILKGMELKPENRPPSITDWLSLLTGKTEMAPSEVIAPVFSQEAHTPKSNVRYSPLPIPPAPTQRRQVMRVPRNTLGTRNYDPFDESRFNQNTNPNPNPTFSSQKVTETSNAEVQPSLQAERETATIKQSSITKPEGFLSAVGMDYSNLQALLSAGKWQEADVETAQLMLKVASQESCLDKSTMKNFPCEDLQTIDKLWVKYSKGRFGFSVQKRIYQSLGGKREFDKNSWDATADKIGWRVNKNWLFQENLNYTLTAPLGHLPSLGISGLLERGIYTLISRCMDCSL